MQLVRLTGPAAEPVTLAEAKQALRVDGNDFDALLSSYIVAAREQVENDTSRSLITTTWRVRRADWCDMALPRLPVASIVAVRYVDASTGARTALDPASYHLLADDQAAGVARAHGVTWPIPRFQSDAVEVEFVAGYGATGDSVPQGLKQALLLLVGAWLADPEGRDRSAGPSPYERLISRYRAWPR